LRGFIPRRFHLSRRVKLSKRSDSSPKSVSEVLAKLSDKNYAFNFDITLELNTPKLQVGSLRVHGRVESIARK